MTLPLQTISQIQQMTLQKISQRAIAAVIGHTLASVNKYSKMLRYYTQDALRLSHYYCRCLLALNPDVQREELEAFIKAELKLSLSKRQLRQILIEEKARLSAKHINMCYQPGEAAQFDWGTMMLTIGGKRKRVYLAVFSFPYSNYRFYYVTQSMKKECFLKAFDAFIHHLGAVPPVLIIDNMRIAVQYKDGIRIRTPLFQQLEQHYNMTVKLCTPHQPQQKGNVENAVRTVKHYLKLQNSYKNEHALIQSLRQWNDILNAQRHHEKNDTIDQLHQHEKAALQTIPKKPFTYYDIKTCKVSSNGNIRFQTNTYSVPEQYSKQTVYIHHSQTTIYIKNNKGTTIAKYTKDGKKRKHHYRIWHMIQKIRTKAAGFVHSHEYKQLPKHLKLLHNKLCNKQTHFFLNMLESFEHEPTKKLKHFIFTLIKENVSYTQLKAHLKLE